MTIKNRLHKLTQAFNESAERIFMANDLILITGASTGIGEALATYFAEKGHTVLAGVRQQKDFDRLNSFGFKTLKPVLLDVTNESQVEKIPALLETYLKSGQKFILINNAGVAVSGPWELVPLEEVKNQISINVLGTINVTKNCIQTLRKTQGKVITISSISGLYARAFMGPYAVSKFALEAFTDSLRRELKPFGVAVCSLNPGPIKTQIWKKALNNPNNTIYEKSPLYGEIFTKKLRQGIEKNQNNFWEAKILVQSVDELVNSQDPRPRLLVAPTIMKIVIRLAQFLPTRMADKLLEKV